MRYFTILLTLLIASSTFGGTLYGPGTTKLDSGTTATNGEIGGMISRQVYRMAFTSSGKLAIIAGSRQTASGTPRVHLVWTANQGGSWTDDDSSGVGIFARVGTNGGMEQYSATIYSFGDSLFAFQDGDSVTGGTAFPSVIRAYNSSMARSVIDTIVNGSFPFNDIKKGGSPGGFTVANGNLRVIHYQEAGSADSVWFLSTGGTLSNSSTWLTIDSTVKSSSSWNAGLRIPFSWSGDVGGGLMLWAPQNNALYWADTACGVDTLATTLITGFPANGGVHTSWIIQTTGKSGLVLWEDTTGGPNAEVYARPFTLSSASSWGTNTDRTLSWDATAQTLATGSTLRNLTVADPSATMLRNSGTDDTVFAIWKDEPDTSGTNWNTRRLSYSVSGNLGATWGARTTLYSIGADTISSLQAPPFTYRSGNNIYLAAAYTDSLTSLDSARVYIETIVTIPATSGGSNVVLRGGVYQGAVIR